MKQKRIFLAVATWCIAALGGCESNPYVPVDSFRPSNVQQAMAPDGGATVLADTGCVSASAMLQPNQNLTLQVANSKVKYESGTINVPTLVSFSICSVDTTNLKVRPKTQVFGPIPALTFLKPVTVQLSSADAGLPMTMPTNSNIWVFRYNTTISKWVQYQIGALRDSKFEYTITQNGTYVLGITDSVWTTSGMLTPAHGGTINLRSSSFTAPPGAVIETTLVSFSISAIQPDGLTSALNRIYDFGPDGTSFRVQTTMRIAFGDAGYGKEDVSPHLIKCYNLDPATNRWIALPTTVDMQRGQFVVNLGHFSRYSFAR